MHLSPLLKTYDDIEGKRIADLGCGTGIFSIGAAIFGAEEVIAFDLDTAALEIAKKNVEEFELEDQVTLVNAEINAIKVDKKVDTVIMNPPFGTKKEGVDMLFLQKALEVWLFFVWKGDSIKKSIRFAKGTCIRFIKQAHER